MTRRDTHSSLEHATVAASVASSLVEFATARGARRRELLHRARLADAALSKLDGRIPMPHYIALMRAAKTLTGDDAFALHFGELVNESEIGILPFAAEPVDDIHEAIGQLNRYAELAVSFPSSGTPRYAFVPRDGALWFVDRHPLSDGFPELAESSFARMICSARSYAGSTSTSSFALSVHFAHRPQHATEEYERVLGVPVVFEAGWNALLLNFAALHAHLPPKLLPPAAAVVRAHARTLVDALASERTVRGQVEKLVTDALPGGARMENVAAKLGLGRKTLHRRLREEGVTFEQLVDDVRKQLAIGYLAHEDLSLADAAFRLGYADTASLSRAVKRWTGRTASELRRHAPDRRR